MHFSQDFNQFITGKLGAYYEQVADAESRNRDGQMNPVSAEQLRRASQVLYTDLNTRVAQTLAYHKIDMNKVGERPERNIIEVERAMMERRDAQAGKLMGRKVPEEAIEEVSTMLAVQRNLARVDHPLMKDSRHVSEHLPEVARAVTLPLFERLPMDNQDRLRGAIPTSSDLGSERMRVHERVRDALFVFDQKTTPLQGEVRAYTDRGVSADVVSLTLAERDTLAETARDLQREFHASVGQLVESAGLGMGGQSPQEQAFSRNWAIQELSRRCVKNYPLAKQLEAAQVRLGAVADELTASAADPELPAPNGKQVIRAVEAAFAPVAQASPWMQQEMATRFPEGVALARIAAAAEPAPAHPRGGSNITRHDVPARPGVSGVQKQPPASGLLPTD